MRQNKASVTIYFTFAIVLIISITLSVTELVRMKGQKLYLKIAANSAIDSFFSLYHRKLYEYYRIYGIEYLDDEQIKKEYISYFSPYYIDTYTDEYINNYFTGKLDENNIEISYSKLVDKDYFEREIIQFEKYDLIGKTIDFFGEKLDINEKFDTLEETVKNVIEISSKKDIYKDIDLRYFDFKNYIKKLENNIKNIINRVKKLNQNINNTSNFDTNGSINSAKKVLKNLQEINDDINSTLNSINSYFDTLLGLKNKIEENKNQFNIDKVSDKWDFDEEIIKFIEEEFIEFEKYTSEYENKNKEITDLKTQINLKKNELSYIYIEFQNEVEELENLSELLKEEQNKKREDRDNDYIDDLKKDIRDIKEEISDYAKELKQNFTGIELSELSFITSNDDLNNNESRLESIKNLLKGNVIDIVLDNEAKLRISNQKYEYESFDTGTNINLINRILVGEYILTYFNDYYKRNNGKVVNSNSDSLEVERILKGKDSDRLNLSEVINEILLIRFTMNMIYLYQNSEKRHMARGFATTLFGTFSPIAVEIMFLLILSSWGVAQSIVDLKDLLKFKRVPLIHNDDTFKVNISSILNIDSFNNSENNDKGLNYTDYLRILLYKSNQKTINENVLSVMQKNLKLSQDSFNIKKMIYSISVNCKMEYKHLFTNFIIYNNADVKLYDKYFLGVNSYYDFLNLKK